MKACPCCHRHVHAAEPSCPFCSTALPSLRDGPVFAIALGLCLAACGPAIDPPTQGDDGSSTSGSSTTSSSSSSSTTGVADTGESGSSSSSGFDTGSSDDTGVGSGGFYGGPPPDGGPSIECDPWEQDCPDGEKCAPWSNNGEEVWNDVRCSPLDPAGDTPGEPCTVEGSAWSGIDSCELGSVCFFVDPSTQVGTCVAQCTGSEAAPLCDDADARCLVANEGSLNLCLPSCDPLLQSCADGQVCVPAQVDFVCMPALPMPASNGDPCELVYGCELGSTCMQADALPACDGVACCTPFCDPDAVDTCPDACVPWSDGVGYCGVAN